MKTSQDCSILCDRIIALMKEVQHELALILKYHLDNIVVMTTINNLSENLEKCLTAANYVQSSVINNTKILHVMSHDDHYQLLKGVLSYINDYYNAIMNAVRASITISTPMGKYNEHTEVQ